MPTVLITIVIVLLAALAAAASGVALHRLFHPDRPSATTRPLTALVAAATVGSALLFVVLWLKDGRWQPIESHIDGLLLIAALFGATILFILTRKHLFGLSAFALPILTFILLWAICAANWTYRPFNLQTLHPVWFAIHLAGVYLGTLGAGVAAVAGAMYLFVQGRLKHKTDLAAMGHLASLETLEKIIVRAATVGFALLSLGLVSGGVIVLENHAIVSGGYAVKIVIAVVAWALYALLMNVRYSAAFRGTRAAWISIVGFVLLIVVYGVVVSLPADKGEGGGQRTEDGSSAMRLLHDLPPSALRSPPSRATPGGAA